MTCERTGSLKVRQREAQENMQRIRFVLLVILAAMLGALISMVDSSPG
jgi:hypothetical protein